VVAATALITAAVAATVVSATAAAADMAVANMAVEALMAAVRAVDITVVAAAPTVGTDTAVPAVIKFIAFNPKSVFVSHLRND
jgi:hypothetical protein